MGTNYYAIEPPCDAPCQHCDQQSEWHICKSLVSFEAHDVSPWGRIESWGDWKRVITQHELTVRDEYGVEHAATEFIASVEATDPTARRRQYQWLVDHQYPLDRDWLDADGYSFHRGEFF